MKLVKSTDKGVPNFLDKCPDYCLPQNRASFQWSKSGVGFGEVHFYIQDGVLCCDNEAMSKTFLKEMFCQMIDECKLDINR